MRDGDVDRLVGQMCDKCGEVPPTEARFGMCEACYQLDRRETWKSPEATINSEETA